MTWLAGRQPRWPTPRLKDVAHVVNGYPFSSDGFNESVGTPLIRIRDLADHSPETLFDGDVPAESIIQRGDLLIGMDGDFSSATWRGSRAALNQRLCKLVARPGLDQRFLAHFVDLPLRAINEITYFTTVKHLSSVDLMNEVIPLPPLAEQRAIADYLDAETARIDALIAKKQQLIHLLEERRTSELIGLLHLEHPPAALKRLFEPTIGGSWGGEPGTGDVDAACIRGTDFDMLRLRVGTSAPIRGYALGDFGSKALRPGDIVIEKSGGGDSQPVGRAVMFDAADPAVPTNFSARLRPKPGHQPEYLVFLLNALYRAGITRSWIKQTTGIQNLDLGGLLSEKVPLPRLPHQIELVRELDRSVSEMQAIASLLTRQLDLLAEHRHALITAAVTGEFVVPGAA